MRRSWRRRARSRVFTQLWTGPCRADCKKFWRRVRRSQECFIAAFAAANALYLWAGGATGKRGGPGAIAHAKRRFSKFRIWRVDDAQRSILKDLGEQIYVLRQGVRRLSGHVKRRAEILSTAIDENQAKMITTIEGLSSEMRVAGARSADPFRSGLIEYLSRDSACGGNFRSRCALHRCRHRQQHHRSAAPTSLLRCARSLLSNTIGLFPAPRRAMRSATWRAASWYFAKTQSRRNAQRMIYDLRKSMRKRRSPICVPLSAA